MKKKSKEFNKICGKIVGFEVFGKKTLITLELTKPIDKVGLGIDAYIRIK